LLIEPTFNFMYVYSTMTGDLKRKTAALREQHVLDAAIRVFRRDGYRGATIRSIAREAGVSDGTIYNVFENKEALLLAALESLLGAGLGSGLGAATPQGHPAMVAGFEELFLAHWKAIDPQALDMVRILWAEALHDPALAARYRDAVMAPAITGFAAIAPVAAAHESEPAPDPHTTARAAMAMFVGLLLLKALGDPVLEAPGEEVAAAAARLLKRGLQSSEQHA
jgi:AcrR family transcriptional regulator